MCIATLAEPIFQLQQPGTHRHIFVSTFDAHQRKGATE